MVIHLRAAAGNDVCPARAGEFKRRALKEYLLCCDVGGVEPNPDVNEDNLAELLRSDEIVPGVRGTPEGKNQRRKDGDS